MLIGGDFPKNWKEDFIKKRQRFDKELPQDTKIQQKTRSIIDKSKERTEKPQPNIKAQKISKASAHKVTELFTPHLEPPPEEVKRKLVQVGEQLHEVIIKKDLKLIDKMHGEGKTKKSPLRMEKIAKSSIHPVTRLATPIYVEREDVKSLFSSEDKLREFFFNATNEEVELPKNLNLLSLQKACDGVTVYKKDSIISSLRVLMQHEKQIVSRQIPQVIHKLNNLPGEYLNEAQFNQAKEHLEINLSELNQTPYILFTDLLALAQSQSNKASYEILKKVHDYLVSQVESYAFKLGYENDREELGGKLLRILGTPSQYFPSKIAATFQHAEFQGIKGPSGIASRWVKEALPFEPVGEGMSSWDIWSAWKMRVKDNEINEEVNLKLLEERLISLSKDLGSLKHNFDHQIIPEKQIEIEQAMQEARDEVSDIKSARQEFNKAQHMILNSLDPSLAKSMQWHALVDILFASSDSHLDQYLVEDENLFNIDFAKFLAAGNILNQGGIYPLLRSILLDHPVASEPISEDIVKEILSWDIHEMQNKIKEQGLSGDLQSFEKAKQTFQGLVKVHEENRNRSYSELGEALKFLEKRPPINFKVHKPALQVLLQKHCKLLGLDQSVGKKWIEDLEQALNKKETPKDLENSFLSLWKKEVERKPILESTLEANPSFLPTLRECYQKVHPKALELFFTRMHRLQDYLRKCQEGSINPTVEEVFKHLYPDFTPFIEYLSRNEIEPHFSIGGKKAPQNLEKLFQKAKSEVENLLEETEEEISKMEKRMKEVEFSKESLRSLVNQPQQKGAETKKKNRELALLEKEGTKLSQLIKVYRQRAEKHQRNLVEMAEALERLKKEGIDKYDLFLTMLPAPIFQRL